MNTSWAKVSQENLIPVYPEDISWTGGRAMDKVKKKNPIAAAHSMRGGAGSGTHNNKSLRGSGKVGGKWGRHPKHKISHS